MDNSLVFILLISLIAISSANVVDLGCSPGWYNWNGYCYYVEKNKLVTRDNANTDCSGLGASLLRVTSQDEMSLVNNLTMTTQSDGFWTSLSDLRFDGTKTASGSWYWDDYVPMSSYPITWEHYPTYNPVESCGALNMQANMTNWKCSKKMGYICEIILTPTAGCPFGWMPTDTACYLFSDTTDPSQLLTWNQAKQRCAQQSLPPNVTTPAKLLTIDDPDDNNYILGEMPVEAKTSTMFWTGLIRNGQTWSWYNNDVFKPSYIHWASEPDNVNGNEHCAIVKPNRKFSDQDCSKKFNYICRTSTNTDNTAYDMGCAGWNRAGVKCYSFYDGPRSTWQAARSTCQSFGGDLLKIQSNDEKTWLEWQMEKTTRRIVYWTGLNDQAVEGSYKWADGVTANKTLIRWNQEPNAYFGNEDCALIFSNGVWNDKSCTIPTQYICEYSNLNNGACPTSSGWYSRSNSSECYYFSARNDSLTWFEAEDACHGMSLSSSVQTTLLAVNDQEEAAWITMMVGKVSFSPTGYWTGLNDRVAEGIWTYPESYNNPVNMGVVNWNGEPSDKTRSENCVFVGYGGRYSDSKCNYKLGFICERFATGFSSYGNSAPVSRSNRFYVLLMTILMMAINL